MEDLEESHLHYFAIPIINDDREILDYLAGTGKVPRAGRTIKTVYIAGPLTPASTTQNHAIEYLVNIRNMVSAGRKLLMAGFYPFVPAFDFLFFMLPPDEGRYCQEPLEISGLQIKEYSMEWLRRCDAVIFLPGWLESSGSVAEFYEAVSLKIRVFFDIKDLLGEAPNAVS